MIDFTKVKKVIIPEGKVKQIKAGSNVLWKLVEFINQVLVSTDADGSIYNGVGYKDNTRLSSSGGVSSSAQNNSVTTGFIPFPTGDKTVIRMKGVQWLNSSQNGYGHYYINFYGANKNFLRSVSAYDQPDLAHIITVSRDANGVETVTFNQDYGTSNSTLQDIRNNAEFIRINAYGKGADFILTINEEIA